MRAVEVNYPELDRCDPAELSRFLLDRGIECSTRDDSPGDGVFIVTGYNITKAKLRAALAKYQPQAKPGTYVEPEEAARARALERGHEKLRALGLEDDEIAALLRR